MTASKFTDARKVFITKQGDDGTMFAEICRKFGNSPVTYFNWKKKHEGLMPSEMRRLRDLEGENNRRKRIVADLTLDREMLHEVIKRSPTPQCRAFTGGRMLSKCAQRRSAKVRTTKPMT